MAIARIICLAVSMCLVISYTQAADPIKACYYNRITGNKLEDKVCEPTSFCSKLKAVTTTKFACQNIVYKSGNKERTCVDTVPDKDQGGTSCAAIKARYDALSKQTPALSAVALKAAQEQNTYHYIKECLECEDYDGCNAAGSPLPAILIITLCLLFSFFNFK